VSLLPLNVRRPSANYPVRSSGCRERRTIIAYLDVGCSSPQQVDWAAAMHNRLLRWAAEVAVMDIQQAGMWATHSEFEIELHPERLPFKVREVCDPGGSGPSAPSRVGPWHDFAAPPIKAS
jgi:hypothetical protein